MKRHAVLLGKTMNQFGIFQVGCLLLLLSSCTSPIAAHKRMFKAEAAKLVGGASGVVIGDAAAGSLVGLSKPGDGLEFTNLPAASKLAIRYASVTNGIISVAVNNGSTTGRRAR